MRTKKFLTLVAVALAAVTAVLAPVSTFAAGDIYDRLFTARTVNANATADDTDVALQCLYVGTSPSGTIQVNASGDLLFKAGAAAAEAAVTDIKCPSGGTNGTVDVSDAACNTVGEVVNIVNASSSFRCVPVDSLLADATDNTGNQFLVASAASANTPLNIFWDTSTAFKSTRLITPWRGTKFKNADGTIGSHIMAWLQGDKRNLNFNAYDGTRSVVLKLTATSTYGSGTSTLQVIDSILTFSGGTAPVASETTFNVENIAGGATTVAKTLDATPFGYSSDIGHRILVRINNSAAASSVSMYPYAIFFRVPKEAASIR